MNTAPANKAPSTAWTWLVLAGVLFVLLAVLAVTTQQRLKRGEELMAQSMTHQAIWMVRSLEGATRASMRKGIWGKVLLQALVEEMADHPHVLSVSILGVQGKIMATARGAAASEQSDDPFKGMPRSLHERILQEKPVDAFLEGELVVGRAYHPFHRFMDRGRRLPPWASPLDQEKARNQPNPMPMMPHGGQHGMMFPRPGEPLQAYALIRLSSKEFLDGRAKAVQEAWLLAALIFAAAGAAAWGIWVAARWRGREITRLRQEIAEAQHLAALGRLAGSVAHEVRNPLSALRGLVQYLAKGEPPDSQKAQYAAAAVEEVDRLARVVSGLLEYTRSREPRRVPLDLAESLRSTVTFMSDDPRASGVEITVEVQEPLPTVLADPDQIRQVLVNLLLNALEALNGKGKIVLRAHADKDKALVEVSDNGPGLPPGEPEQIFDPFFSTHERGTGLGLAIARRIIRAHGGDITAGASEQGGALITFHLPLNKEKP